MLQDMSVARVGCGGIHRHLPFTRFQRPQCSDDGACAVLLQQAYLLLPGLHVLPGLYRFRYVGGLVQLGIGEFVRSTFDGQTIRMLPYLILGPVRNGLISSFGV